jgi:hypothetical protein
MTKRVGRASACSVHLKLELRLLLISPAFFTQLDYMDV